MCETGGCDGGSSRISRLKKVIEEGKQVKAGDKLYAVNMKKSLALFQIGKQPLKKEWQS